MVFLIWPSGFLLFGLPDSAPTSFEICRRKSKKCPSVLIKYFSFSNLIITCPWATRLWNVHFNRALYKRHKCHMDVHKGGGVRICPLTFQNVIWDGLFWFMDVHSGVLGLYRGLYPPLGTPLPPKKNHTHVNQKRLFRFQICGLAICALFYNFLELE